MTTALISAHAAGMLAKGSGITLDPIAKPLAAVLAFFYSIVPNYGIAIFLLTVAMMIVLTPLSIKQTRSMLAMQRLQPQLKRLQETHKNDRQAMNEAVMALYKEHGVSPLGGCLPMLLPLPVFIALLRVLEGLSRKVNGVSHPKYLTSSTRMYQDIVHAMGKLDAFGMDLAKSARTINGSFATKLPYFVLLLLMVGTQYYQQAQLTSRNPQAQGQPGQAAMMKFIPLFFGLISIQFPAGVIIYWTVSNMIRILTQSLMYRYDPKIKALATQELKEVEAKTRELEVSPEGEDKTPGRPRFRDLLKGAANSPEGEDKAPGRPRFRDLLNGAAAGRDGDKGQGAKGAAKSGGRPGSGKPAPGGKNSVGKPGITPGSGSQKPGTGRPGAPKPGAPRPGSAKSGPLRPGGAKPGGGTAGSGKPGGGPRAGTGAGAGKPAGVKPAGAKPTGGNPGAAKGSGGNPGGGNPGGGNPGGGKPGGTKPGGGAAGTAKPGGAKPGGGSAGTANPAGAKPSGNQGAAKPAGAKPGVASPGNGAGAKQAPAAKTTQQPAKPAADAQPAAATGNGDAAPTGDGTGNGAPGKGRTGAGSARNVVGRHRRARRGR